MRKYQLLAITALLSTISFAKDNFKNIVLVSSENRNVVLAYYGLEMINTTLTITDQFSSVLFQETKKTPDSLEREFLLQKLNGDTFIVHLENKYKSIQTTYKFDNSKDSVMAQGNPIEIFKPVFLKKGKEVTVYLLNSFQRKVIIEVIDKNGDALVPKIISTKSAITQVFDFSSFTSKARIRIKNGEYFSKEFAF